MKIDTSKLSFATKYWLALGTWFVAGFILSGMEFSEGRAKFLGVAGTLSGMVLVVVAVESAFTGKLSGKGKS